MDLTADELIELTLSGESDVSGDVTVESMRPVSKKAVRHEATLAPACPDPNVKKVCDPGQLCGDPMILGALDKSLIDAVLKRNMNQIRGCHEKAIKGGLKAEGRLTEKFVIAKDGTVSSASTKCSDLDNWEVEDCLNTRFARFQFPEPKGGGIVIVSYPFVFSLPD